MSLTKKLESACQVNMQVRWTEPALDDLVAIQNYIAKDSPLYAQQFTERIFDVAKNLELFPELGRKVPEAAESSQVRELIFQNYRIMYLTDREHVYIITVIHGSRDLSALKDRI